MHVSQRTKFCILAFLAFLTTWQTRQVLAADTKPLVVNLRYRAAEPDQEGLIRVFCQQKQWRPQETAIIVCDMWDQHWCQGATRRVVELTPVMNQVISAARQRKVFIIHSPSGTMDHYQGHPARQRVKHAPPAASFPEGIAKWCHWKDAREETAGYPIDHKDGGCDCQPTCQTASPWRRQVAGIRIDEKDAISDSGVEIWNLLESRGIKNIILMGVHTNMCVLGRPFGLRNLAKAGKNVVLMRDLTDTMYNSRQAPYVNHFTGTDLVINHIETYVCPTITSTLFTNKPPFRFKNDTRPLVVFISAEGLYGSAFTLPDFAQELELSYGLCCEILQGSTERKGDDRHTMAGMDMLTQAELAVVFARRRAFPADQFNHLRTYLDRGGALIGIRTASHAFDTRGNAPSGHSEWPRFDPEVLGGNYDGHYKSGPKTTVTAAATASSHPVLKGVHLPFLSNGSLYRTKPLVRGTTPLLIGTIPGQDSEPVGWIHRYQNSRVFYTSLGHADDFKNPQFRRLLVNAISWALQKSLPVAKRR